MAFGAVLEGPDPVNLRPIVEQAMPMLIELMHDPSVVVKDTAAWTIGRVCELHTEAAINEVMYPQSTLVQVQASSMAADHIRRASPH